MERENDLTAIGGESQPTLNELEDRINQMAHRLGV